MQGTNLIPLFLIAYLFYLQPFKYVYFLWYFKRKGVKVEGVVKDIHVKSSTREYYIYSYYPKEREHIGVTEHHLRRGTYKVGDSIPIAFLKKDPRRAMAILPISSVKSNFKYFLLFGTLALVLGLALSYIV